jgi:hypothetical protein
MNSNRHAKELYPKEKSEILSGLETDLKNLEAVLRRELLSVSLSLLRKYARVAISSDSPGLLHQDQVLICVSFPVGLIALPAKEDMLEAVSYCFSTLGVCGCP